MHDCKLNLLFIRVVLLILVCNTRMLFCKDDQVLKKMINFTPKT